MILGLTALSLGDLRMLIAAYAIYWIGDMADGWTARRLAQETRTGAVFDIVSDRACTGVAACALVTVNPDALAPVIAFLVSFMVLDTMLSLAFLCWPLLSPNHFHVVDRNVWILNWSPTAKAANTAGVIGALAVGQYAIALIFVLVVGLVKLWSLHRVVELLQRSAT